MPYPRRRRSTKPKTASKSKKASSSMMSKKPRRKYVKVRGYRKKYVSVRRIQGRSGLLTQSLLSLRHKASPLVSTQKKVGSPNIYITNEPYSLSSSTPGTQLTSYSEFMTVSDLQRVGNRLPTATGPRRLLIESVLAESTYTNNTTASVEFELIDLACKRDLPFYNTYNVNGADINFGANPVSVWGADSAGCTGGTLPFPAFNYLGTRPFDGQMFADYFKVLKRTIVMLPQGGSHRHVVNLKPNRLLDEAIWNSQGQTSVNTQHMENLAGMSVYTLIIAKGFPVSATGGTTPVSTAYVKIDAIRQSRYKFSWVEDISKTISLDDIVQPDAAASANIINVGSGAVEKESNA